jgi:peptide deformylase
MILKAPDPKLRQVSVKCTFAEGKLIGKRLLQAVENAKENSAKHHMVIVGLAAPQIGINKRVFVADGITFINPVLLGVSSKTIESREGCLSLGDDDVFTTKRPVMVSLQWFDTARRLHRRTFTGHAATIVKHEMDHLEGRLCNDVQSATAQTKAV